VADGYFVDVPAITKLIDTLQRAEHSIKAATHNLRDANTTALGSPAIDKAGDAFCKRWDASLSKIAKVTGKVTEDLNEAKKEYLHREEQNRQRFHGGAGR